MEFNLQFSATLQKKKIQIRVIILTHTYKSISNNKYIK